MSILLLYKTGGSQDIQLLQEMPQAQYDIVKRNAIRYLKASHAAPGTIEMLEELPFLLYQATNDFGDDFEVLYMTVGAETFVDIENEVGIWQYRAHEGSHDVAKAFEVAGHPLRFIAAKLDFNEGVAEVSSPALVITSDTVEEALRHAQTLIETHGAASGLDRVHTAMHGYLLSVCENANIPVPADGGITELFARLREHHPSLSITDPEAKARTDQILRGMARVIDALDPLRNRKTLAHPNTLLDDAEAMLAINLVRTMLHYLDAKLR